MPARYHEGARRAYKSGRWPIAHDIEATMPQEERMWMLRQLIKRLYDYPKQEKQESPWPKKYYAKILKEIKSNKA